MAATDNVSTDLCNLCCVLLNYSCFFNLGDTKLLGLVVLALVLTFKGKMKLGLLVLEQFSLAVL